MEVRFEGKISKIKETDKVTEVSRNVAVVGEPV